MSAQDVENEILEPMQRLFLPPRQMGQSEQIGALREYVAGLQHFSATELNVAWTTVRDTHMQRSWPLPAAFVMAARQARKYARDAAPEEPPRRRPGMGELGTWEDWTAAKTNPKAREAVRMEVAWAFKCAVLHDGRRPDEIDLAELRLGKNQALRTRQKIIDGAQCEWKGRKFYFSADNRELALRMWETIEQRERETQAEINFARRAA